MIKHTLCILDSVIIYIFLNQVHCLVRVRVYTNQTIQEGCGIIKSRVEFTGELCQFSDHLVFLTLYKLQGGRLGEVLIPEAKRLQVLQIGGCLSSNITLSLRNFLLEGFPLLFLCSDVMINNFHYETCKPDRPSSPSGPPILNEA